MNKDCEFCGDPFYVKPSKYDIRRFCCKKCELRFKSGESPFKTVEIPQHQRLTDYLKQHPTINLEKARELGINIYNQRKYLAKRGIQLKCNRGKTQELTTWELVDLIKESHNINDVICKPWR